MDFLKQNKVTILGGVAILLAGYVYFAYFSTAPTSATVTSSDSNAALSQKLLITLQNLHTIKLDDSIFTDPAYKSLNNFGVTIPAENIGRRNPFYPVDVGAKINNSIVPPVKSL